MSKVAVELCINGERHEVLTAPHRTLLDVLRADLGLTMEQTGTAGAAARTVALSSSNRWACDARVTSTAEARAMDESGSRSRPRGSR